MSLGRESEFQEIIKGLVCFEKVEKQRFIHLNCLHFELFLLTEDVYRKKKYLCKVISRTFINLIIFHGLMDLL